MLSNNPSHRVMANYKPHHHSFLRRHSLSLVTAGILLLWIVLYIYADPQTHLGSFFGNAIADWSGVLVTVLATKHLYEKGSVESRIPRNEPANPILAGLEDHSLTIFLVVTGAGWILLFKTMNANGKWGQVVGNIVSEWTQIIGLVLLTKRLLERGSKESKR